MEPATATCLPLIRLPRSWAPPAPQDFPYYVEPGIAHYNLWASRPLAPAELRARIAAHVPPGAEALHFVNPPVLQSVPGIW